MSENTDEELVLRARKGDTDAFGELVQRYISTISILAYQKTNHRSEAEDIAQEAFVRAYRALETLKDPAKFGGWIYNIAFRLCLDYLRKKSSRRPVISFDELEAKGLEPYEPDRGKEQRDIEERSQSLKEAIDKLPDLYRLVVTLRYMNKMSYKDIADHLNEPEGTIANRLHRATRLLKDRMSKGAEKQS
jgi:RNA polymerase sigma-70 factor, ECF subfamily